MAKCLICERVRPGMGRDLDRTFVNVAVNKKELGKSTETLAEYAAREPWSAWLDPAFNEFAIEVDPDFYRDVGVEESSVIPLRHDGRSNQPRFQQRDLPLQVARDNTSISFDAAGGQILGPGLFGAIQPGDKLHIAKATMNSGERTVTAASADAVTLLESVVDAAAGPEISIWRPASRVLGSHADPTDAGSTFTVDQELPDDRFRVRVLDAASDVANVLEDEEFTADPDGVIKIAERFIRVYRPDDTPLNTNAANQRTDVGRKLIDFDFGSEANPPLPAGFARFFVDINDGSPGNTGTFGSNHRYKIITPSGRDFYQWKKYSKVVPLDD